MRAGAVRAIFKRFSADRATEDDATYGAATQVSVASAFFGRV